MRLTLRTAACFFLSVDLLERDKKLGNPQTAQNDIPAVSYKLYPTYMAGKLNVSELARVCGLSRPTVYKYLKMVG